MKNKKYKIVALFGKSGAGKTYLKDNILKFDKGARHILHNIITTTTRPIREGEENGKDYHFISASEFTKKIYNDEIIEAALFNDWAYGTQVSALVEDKVNIGCFSPTAIENLIADPRCIVMPFYLSAPDRVRLQRCLSREGNPDCAEICRRFLADKKDFDDFEFSYKKVEGGYDNIYEQVVRLYRECEIFMNKTN